MRVDRELANRLRTQQGSIESIRKEIEARITISERIPTSVEVPLTTDCKKALNLAGQESDRLGHRHIGTEHLLLSLLQMEGSLASQVLQARGLNAQEVRESLAKPVPAGSVGQPPCTALCKLEGFLAGLKRHNSGELLPFFAQNAQFVDVYGKRWNREEIQKAFETLFAPYAKKNANLHGRRNDSRCERRRGRHRPLEKRRPRQYGAHLDSSGERCTNSRRRGLAYSADSR